MKNLEKASRNRKDLTSSPQIVASARGSVKMAPLQDPQEVGRQIRF